MFVRREDAKRFIEEIRSGEPELATELRVEERELEVGGAGSTGLASYQSDCWHPSTCSRNARPPEVTGSPARRRLQFDLIHSGIEHNVSVDTGPSCRRIVVITTTRQWT